MSIGSLETGSANPLVPPATRPWSDDLELESAPHSGRLAADLLAAMVVAGALLLAGWGEGWIMLAVAGLLFAVSLILLYESAHGRSRGWAILTASAGIAVAGVTVYDAVTRLAGS